MTRSRMTLFTLALSASATLFGCGAARMSMEVPLTLSERMEPEATLAPRDGVATLVIVYAAPADGNTQAMTFVSQTGAFLGQVGPRSYLVTTVPAGELGVFAGRPEMTYSEWCHGVRGSVDAGKMYVLLASSSFGLSGIGAADPERFPADRLGQELSSLSRLRPNQAKGESSTQAVLQDYWKPCMKRVDEEAPSPNAGFTKLANAKSSARIHAEWGYGPLTISSSR